MSATIKIAHNSPSHANPSELEQQIAQALFDLESSVTDLKAALRPLQFTSAKEVIYTPPLRDRTQSSLPPLKDGTGLLTVGSFWTNVEDSSRLAMERRLL